LAIDVAEQAFHSERFPRVASVNQNLRRGFDSQHFTHLNPVSVFACGGPEIVSEGHPEANYPS
jgi:hypothetical protein